MKSRLRSLVGFAFGSFFALSVVFAEPKSPADPFGVLEEAKPAEEMPDVEEESTPAPRRRSSLTEEQLRERDERLERDREERLKQHEARVREIIESRRANPDQNKSGKSRAAKSGRFTPGQSVLTVISNEQRIEQVVTMISNQTGVPIGISEGLEGKRVTLIEKDTPLTDVLDKITLPRGWKWVFDGEKVILMTPEHYDDVYVPNNQEMKSFNLENAKAEDVTRTLSPYFPKDGEEIEVDSRTNTLVVTALPERLMVVERIVEALDRTSIDESADWKVPNVKVETFMFEAVLPSQVIDIVRSMQTDVGSASVVGIEQALVVADTPDAMVRIAKTLRQIEEDARMELEEIE